MLQQDPLLQKHPLHYSSNFFQPCSVNCCWLVTSPSGRSVGRNDYLIRQNQLFRSGIDGCVKYESFGALTNLNKHLLI